MFRLLLFTGILLFFVSCEKSELDKKYPNDYLTGLIYFPTAFTPNGDGINDDFIVAGSGIGEFKMKIYNSWDFCIFDGTGTINNLKWDGKKANGKVHGDGKYRIKFSYKTSWGDYNIGEMYIKLFGKDKYEGVDTEELIFPDQLNPVYGPVYLTKDPVFN